MGAGYIASLSIQPCSRTDHVIALLFNDYRARLCLFPLNKPDELSGVLTATVNSQRWPSVRS